MHYEHYMLNMQESNLDGRASTRGDAEPAIPELEPRLRNLEPQGASTDNPFMIPTVLFTVALMMTMARLI